MGNNTFESSVVNLTKDTTAPTIALTTPADSSQITSVNDSATFAVNGTCSENSRLVVIQINGANADSQTGMVCDGTNFSGTIDTTTAPNAALNFTAIISDLAGNQTTSATNIVTKDNVPPAVAITSPTNNSSINQGNDSATFAISGTCNKNGRVVSILINGNPAASPVGFICDGTNFTGTIDVTSETEGAIALKARMLDINNNPFDSSVISLVKDVTLPSFTYNTHSIINISNQSNYIINGTCSEDGSSLTISLGGVDNFPTCNSGNWATSGWNVSGVSDGAGLVITGSITDPAGNSSTPLLSFTNKDTIIPTVAITDYPDITTANETSYTLVGTCSEDSTAVDISIGVLNFSTSCSSGTWILNNQDVSSLPDNSNTSITANHTDGAGNNATPANQIVDKTTNVPLVFITNAPDINQANHTAYTVSGTCSENGRIVDVNIGSININPNCSGGSWNTGAVDVSALADNPSLLITADHDNAVGTPAAQASINVSKDTAVPTVTFTNPQNINFNNQDNYTVSGTCSENGQAVNVSIGTLNYSPTCSGGTWIVGPSDVGSLPDNPSLLLTADHQSSGGTPAQQATAYIVKETLTPTVSSLSVPSTLSNSADLDWTLEDPGGFTINDYLIQYRLQGSSTWLTFNDGTSTDTNTTVTGLNPSTTYEFQVAVVYDSSNQSAFATPVNGETQPDNPIFSPNTSMNVGGATTSTVAAHQDNTNVLLNDVALVTLNAGQTHTFTSAQFDVIKADKPIYTAGRLGSGATNAKGNFVWNNSSWAGKSFSFNAIRSNPQNLQVYAFENTTVEVRQGATVLASSTISANSGGNLSWSVYGSYQVVSTGTILAYHYSGGAGTIVDPKPLLPGHTELIGIPSRSGRLTVLENGTNYTITHSNSVAITGNLDRQENLNFGPEGTQSLMQEESSVIRADKIISAASFADSNGYCAAAFLPTNLMKKNYVINANSDYVAFASLQPGTIDVIDNSGTVVETLTLTRSGGDTTAPYKARRNTASSGGYRFVATVPVAAYYHPTTDTGASAEDETLLYGYD